MSNVNITDEVLYRCVPLAEHRLIELLPSEQELRHMFSIRFEHKMKKVIRQYRRSPFVNTMVLAGRRIAVILLIAILISFTTVVSVEAYRNRFFNIVKNIYKELTSITFEADEEPADIKFESIQPQYIPEGFTEKETEKTYSSEFTIYRNAMETDIIYEQTYITNNQIIVDTEDTEIEHITVNGIEVEYFYNKGFYQFMWYKDHYAFSLISSMKKDELIKMIESIYE